MHLSSPSTFRIFLLLFISTFIFVIQRQITHYPSSAFYSPTRANLKNNYKNILWTIAHRGSQGELPESSLQALELAIDQGADIIEVDLALSNDLVPVIFHDLYLSSTTNVASKPKFASRKRYVDFESKKNGKNWWIFDFTLSELKSLRLLQRYSNRNQKFNNLYEIPTLEEVIQLIIRRNSKLMIEIKSVEIFNELIQNKTKQSNFTIIDILMEKLQKYSLPTENVFLISFNSTFIFQIAKKYPKYKCLSVHANTPRRMPSYYSKVKKNKKIYGVLLVKESIMTKKTNLSNGSFIIEEQSTVVKSALDIGLKVFLWVLAPDRKPIKAPFKDEMDQLNHYYCIGVSGFETDFPSTVNKFITSYNKQCVFHPHK